MLTSSLADTVMIHLAEQVAPGIDVLFLDTGYHFVETIGTRDAVAAVHDVNLITLTPAQTVAEQDATWGKDLFVGQPRPVLRAAQDRAPERGPGGLHGLGQRGPAGRLGRPGEDARSCPGTCAARSSRSPRSRPGPTTTSPTTSKRNSLMINPLLEDGYPSIGCEPCTSRATADDPRGGRWAGLAKTECGIHL